MIELKKASPKAIRYACLHFHYAKSVPALQYSYNVYEDGEWCGVILFSSGATPNIAKPFDLVQGEVLELVRVALKGKQNTTSECVAAALRKLHEDAPQIKIIVSFADADQNHVGTIYQATNWIYLGLRDEKDTYFIVHGKRVHRRTIGANGGVQSLKWIQENLDADATILKTKGKQKYIFVFNKKLRREWQKKALPYPKKAVKLDGETANKD